MTHRGKLLTIDQASEYTGLGERRLRALVRTKQIAFVRDGDSTARRRAIDGSVHTCAVGRLLFCTSDLDAYVESRRTPAQDSSAPAHVEPSASLADYLPPPEQRRFM